MMKTLIFIAVAALVLSSAPAAAQQSDFAYKKNFEDRFQGIKKGIDSAKAMATLDSLRPVIDALERDFSPRSDFLDKALYPETFAEKITTLRNLHLLTYDRIYLIQTQGVHITELESKISFLSSRLDSLSAQRDLLFSELQESKKNAAMMRDAIKRLTLNLQVKDRLIYALIDSIFLPYGKDFSQIGTMQREAIGKRLENANVVSRVYEIALDNKRFLEVTQLQGKDYANLIDQYQQFDSHWRGLRDKMVAVATAPEPQQAEAATKGKKARGTTLPPAHFDPAQHVDSAIAEWQTKLQSSFWAALAREFSGKNVSINPFTDGKSFSASVRECVERYKASGEDPSVFVNDIWKNRVDREWRDALMKETMLGKTEYASLDKIVSELGQEKVDQKFIIYSLIVILIVFLSWWFFIRKPKAKVAVQAPPEPPKE